MPQGAIDGPLLFNLLVIDFVLFLSETFLSNYADYNNLYSIGKELNIIKEKLRKDFKVVIDWLFEIYMSLNPTKYHYVYLGKSKENDTFNFGNISLKNSKEGVILGLTVDNKLPFDNHVKKICRKASQKTCALSRISNYLDSKQKEIVFKGMIRSQFSYCPLIWMFSSRKSNNLINKVHERSLRIVSGDNHSSFKSLLSKYKEIAIHQRNLQVLMTETYKIINGITPPIMEKIFVFRENAPNVRNFHEISNEKRKTVKYGIETILNRTPFLLANLPNEYKLATSLPYALRQLVKQLVNKVCYTRYQVLLYLW